MTAVQMVSSIAVLPVVTRVLGPESFGVVATCLVLSQLLSYCVGLGLPSIATREFFAAGDGSGLDRARQLATSGMLFALAICAVLIVSIPLWAGIFGLDGSRSALAAAVATPIPAVCVLGCQGILLALDRPGWFVTLGLVVAGGGQVAGLGLVLLGGGPAAYLGGLLAGYLVAACLGMMVTRLLTSGVPGVRVLRPALAIALPAVFHAAAALVLNSGDRILVERRLGMEQVGRYQIAYAIGSLGLSLVAAVNNAWAPMIYRASAGERWVLLRRSTESLDRLVVPVAGVLAVGAPFALLLLAPPSFSPLSLAPVASVTALAVVPYVWYLSAAHVLFQSGKTRPLALLTPLVAALNLALNVALLPTLGLVGAALATLFAYAAWAVTVRWAASRHAMVGWYGRSELVSAAAAVALTVVGCIASTGATGLAVRGAAVAGLAALFVVELRRFGEPQLSPGG